MRAVRGRIGPSQTVLVGRIGPSQTVLVGRIAMAQVAVVPFLVAGVSLPA